MRILDWQQLSEEERNESLARPMLAANQGLWQRVSEVLAHVRDQRGDGVLTLRKRFEAGNDDPLVLDEATLRERAALVNDDVREAIALAQRNIGAFHKPQLPRGYSVETSPGTLCEQRWTPLQRVGLYVPGGSAPLVSSLLMQAIPAQIAGVDEVTIATPGLVAPEICHAALRCGVTRVLSVGGAQAIAALAFGIDGMEPVSKISGPGNAWVTAAKQQVAQIPGGPAIDMPAGPSEVMVIADGSARADFVAADLLSQAEHGADSQALLVTTNRRLAESVAREVRTQLAVRTRRSVIEASLAAARLVVVTDLNRAIEIANRYAPEHLIIQTRDDERILQAVRNAGSIFVGAFTPESAGDYATGTNHVLPTAGYARAYAGLKVSDYMRSYTVQRVSRAGLAALAPVITTLADVEGLDAHHYAVDVRLGTNSEQTASAPQSHAAPLPRACVQQLVPYASARRSGPNRGDVWLNANEGELPEFASDSPGLNRYPDFQPQCVVKAYAAYANVSTKCVLMTRGADEGIDIAIRAFCEPGLDSVLQCSPTYGMYAISAESLGVKVVDLRRKIGEPWEANTIARSARESCARVVCLCSPNNPTGELIPLHIIDETARVLPDRLLLIDEAYVEFSDTASAASLIDRFPNLLVLRTLSKAFGLAGVRAGFALAQPPLIEILAKVLAPYPIPTPVSRIVGQALSTENIRSMLDRRNDLVQRRAALSSALNDLNCIEEVYPSQTNFLLLKPRNASSLFAALKSFGLVVRYFPEQQDLQGLLRVSIGSAEECASFLGAINRFEEEGRE